jgi:hypothetical protein
MGTLAIRNRKPEVAGPGIYQAASTKMAPSASWSLRLSGKWAERQGRIRLLAVVVVAVTVLQRFAVPGTGRIVGVGFALGVTATLFGLGRRILRIEPGRLVLYVVMISGLLVTLLAKSSYSLGSFFMLAGLYLPFIAMFIVSAEEYRQGLNIFQRIMALLAVAGLLQMAVQLVGRQQDWMFPLDLLLPEQVFISQFNLRIPITDSLPYLKSNGLVFLEPSHFSQFLALSILIELAYFRRVIRLALLGSAYLTSFSGTGVILLLAVALPLMVRSRQYLLLTLVAFGIMLLPWLHDIPPFSLFLSRVDEFSNPFGSGSMRFFGPYWLTSDVMLGHPTALLFGYGPGSVGDITGLADYEVLDTSWLKLLVEYGVIGVASFLPFYLYVLLAHSPDRLLCAISVPCSCRMATHCDSRSGAAPTYWFRKRSAVGSVRASRFVNQNVA